MAHRLASTLLAAVGLRADRGTAADPGASPLRPGQGDDLDRVRVRDPAALRRRSGDARVREQLGDRRLRRARCADQDPVQRRAVCAGDGGRRGRARACGTVAATDDHRQRSARGAGRRYRLLRRQPHARVRWRGAARRSADRALHARRSRVPGMDGWLSARVRAGGRRLGGRERAARPGLLHTDAGDLHGRPTGGRQQPPRVPRCADRSPEPLAAV
jgi:hypothetical protein